MAETGTPTNESGADAQAPAAGGRTKDEVALELMRFIALQTGYGKSPQSSAGFSGKPGAHSAEEHAEALLELFLRCRQVVNQEE
ncbi:MAG: hypothetical protein ABSH42_08085 [Bryobacteraceae bacterium]|jgi:hypothetical protein